MARRNDSGIGDHKDPVGAQFHGKFADALNALDSEDQSRSRLKVKRHERGLIVRGRYHASGQFKGAAVVKKLEQVAFMRLVPRHAHGGYWTQIQPVY